MLPERFEIWRVKIILNECEDVRPCIILEVYSNGEVGIMPLSGQLDLYRTENEDFWMDERDDEFRTMGLAKTCYAIGDQASVITPDQIIEKRGYLSGRIREDFANWY